MWPAASSLNIFLLLRAIFLRQQGHPYGRTSHLAFDLGQGSIGQAVRQGMKFPHKESLLIPTDFAETKTTAKRRHMWRTRQAHRARERWLHLRVLHHRRISLPALAHNLLFAHRLYVPKS